MQIAGTDPSSAATVIRMPGERWMARSGRSIRIARIARNTPPFAPVIVTARAEITMTKSIQFQPHWKYPSVPAIRERSINRRHVYTKTDSIYNVPSSLCHRPMAVSKFIVLNAEFIIFECKIHHFKCRIHHFRILNSLFSMQNSSHLAS